MARGRKRTVYMIFDGRARGNAGIEDAVAITVEKTLPEARETANNHGDAAIYKFDVQGASMSNPRWVEDSDV